MSNVLLCIHVGTEEAVEIVGTLVAKGRLGQKGGGGMVGGENSENRGDDGN